MLHHVPKHHPAECVLNNSFCSLYHSIKCLNITCRFGILLSTLDGSNQWTLDILYMQSMNHKESIIYVYICTPQPHCNTSYAYENIYTVKTAKLSLICYVIDSHCEWMNIQFTNSIFPGTIPLTLPWHYCSVFDVNHFGGTHCTTSIC